MMISKMMVTAKAILRAALLVLLMVACASVISSRAQEQPAPSEPNQASTDPAQKSARQPGGPGRQLVHESKEAAGEEKDEYAEFKQSSSVKGIARLTGLGLQKSYWLSLVLNFVIIAGAIIWAARKYLPGIFRDRTAAIQKAMQEAQKASEEARRRLAEIESRLLKLDVEIGAIRDAAEKEGAAEEARIKAAAEEDARKIVRIGRAGNCGRGQGGAPSADRLRRRSCGRIGPETDSRRCRHRSGIGAKFRRPVGRIGVRQSGKDRN